MSVVLFIQNSQIISHTNWVRGLAVLRERQQYKEKTGNSVILQIHIARSAIFFFYARFKTTPSQRNTGTPIALNLSHSPHPL